MTTPIDAVFTALRNVAPDVNVERLAVTHPADDTNLWFITSPNRPGEIQIDSHPGGQPPFSIESDQHNQRIETTSVEHAARTINQWLSPPD